MKTLEQYKEERERFITDINNVNLPGQEEELFFNAIEIDPKQPIPQWREEAIVIANFPTVARLLESTRGKDRLISIIQNKFTEAGFLIKISDMRTLKEGQACSSNFQRQLYIVYTIYEGKS